jgi:hypothetical protein
MRLQQALVDVGLDPTRRMVHVYRL